MTAEIEYTDAAGMLCLSCSLLHAREVNPSPACIQRHHALITPEAWRNRLPDHPAPDSILTAVLPTVHINTSVG